MKFPRVLLAVLFWVGFLFLFFPSFFFFNFFSERASVSYEYFASEDEKYLAIVSRFTKEDSF